MSRASRVVYRAFTSAVVRLPTRGEQVERSVSLKIDDHRAVTLPPPQRPIVDADHDRLSERGQGGPPHGTQQGVGADRQLQQLRDAASRFASQAQAQKFQDVARSRRTAPVAARDLWQLLRKNPRGTAGRIAEELAAAPTNGHASSLPGEILERARITTVHPRAAGWPHWGQVPVGRALVATIDASPPATETCSRRRLPESGKNGYVTTATRFRRLLRLLRMSPLR